MGRKLATAAAVATIIGAIVGILSYLLPRSGSSVAPPPGTSDARTTPNQMPTMPTLEGPTTPIMSTSPVSPTHDAPTTTHSDAPDIVTTPDIQPVFLSKMSSSGGYGYRGRESETILGETYAESITICSRKSISDVYCAYEAEEEYWVEYAAPASMNSFRVVIGLSDSSPSTCVMHAGVSVGGVVEFDEVLAVGSRYERSWAVAPGTRVILSAFRTASSTTQRCMVVFGNARFEPSSVE